MGVKGELAKQVVVAASGKASIVPAHALATVIVWQIQTTVNELSVSVTYKVDFTNEYTLI